MSSKLIDRQINLARELEYTAAEDFAYAVKRELEWLEDYVRHLSISNRVLIEQPILLDKPVSEIQTTNEAPDGSSFVNEHTNEEVARNESVQKEKRSERHDEEHRLYVEKELLQNEQVYRTQENLQDSKIPADSVLLHANEHVPPKSPLDFRPSSKSNDVPRMVHEDREQREHHEAAGLKHVSSSVTKSVKISESVDDTEHESRRSQRLTSRKSTNVPKYTPSVKKTPKAYIASLLSKIGPLQINAMSSTAKDPDNGPVASEPDTSPSIEPPMAQSTPPDGHKMLDLASEPANRYALRRPSSRSGGITFPALPRRESRMTHHAISPDAGRHKFSEPTNLAATAKRPALDRNQPLNLIPQFHRQSNSIRRASPEPRPSPSENIVSYKSTKQMSTHVRETRLPLSPLKPVGNGKRDTIVVDEFKNFPSLQYHVPRESIDKKPKQGGFSRLMAPTFASSSKKNVSPLKSQAPRQDFPARANGSPTKAKSTKSQRAFDLEAVDFDGYPSKPTKRLVNPPLLAKDVKVVTKPTSRVLDRAAKLTEQAKEWNNRRLIAHSKHDHKPAAEIRKITTDASEPTHPLHSTPTKRASLDHIQEPPSKRMTPTPSKSSLMKSALMNQAAGRTPKTVTSTSKFDRKAIPFHTMLPSNDLPEIVSDSEEDDSGRILQPWASSPLLRESLRQQSTIDPDSIFGPIAPLHMEEVFRDSKSARLQRPRGSSANWSSNKDALSAAEVKQYAKQMGYQN